MRPLTFETRIETERPGLVFDGIADLGRWSLFTGWGPMPGIARAELEQGSAVGEGAVVRVTNTDRSVHRERIERWDHGRALRIRFELGPPASWVLASIVETMDWDGAALVRRMALQPRGWWTVPSAYVVRWMLIRALSANNRMLEAATAG